MDKLSQWINSFGYLFALALVEILREAKRSGLSVDELLASAESRTAENDEIAQGILDRINSQE